MSNLTNFITQIKSFLQTAQTQVYKSVNESMTKTYFEIGKRIVEEEQKGQKRAEYGKEFVKEIKC